MALDSLTAAGRSCARTMSAAPAPHVVHGTARVPRAMAPSASVTDTEREAECTAARTAHRTVVLLASLLSFAPARASAQAAELGPPAAMPAGEETTDATFVEHIAAVEGDRRAADAIFREGLHLFPDSTLLRLAHQAYAVGLDPRVALRLDDGERAEALRQSDGVRLEHWVGILLGVPAAISGLVALGLLFGGLFRPSGCATVAGVSICGTSTDQGMLAASAITGGASLTLVATALGLQIDAGEQRSGWRRRLERTATSVALTPLPQGGALLVGGAF